MNPHDAWSCTLREWVLFSTCKEKKPLRKEQGVENKAEIMEQWELRDLHNGY